MATAIPIRVRDVIKSHGWLHVDLSALADTDDLYAAGLTSHSTVNLMVALEEAFDVEFPDRLLRRSTFASIESITKALSEIGVHKEAA